MYSVHSPSNPSSPGPNQQKTEEVPMQDEILNAGLHKRSLTDTYEKEKEIESVASSKGTNPNGEGQSDRPEPLEQPA